MKKKSLLSLMIVIALLASIISMPVFAEVLPTFRLEGKVVLPENAPAGNLVVTLEYRSDKGTPELTDDYTTNQTIVLMAGSRETSFTWDLPYTATADKSSKFVLGYSIPSTSSYWDNGYYTLSGGMQYYKEVNTILPEGARSGIVITPLQASEISGTVGLPAYITTQGAIEVDVSAKTTGTLSVVNDDVEVKARVSINGSAISYKLKVPTTVTTAGYVVKYDTKAANAAEYEKQGYYSTTGTVLAASAATVVDVSIGNRTNINMLLIKKTILDPTTPFDKKFDVNGDNRLDIKDHVMVARAMGSKNKYDAKFDFNDDKVVDVKDLKLIKAEIEKARRLEKQLKKVANVNGNGKTNGNGKGK